ncbi:DUF397 domain-containing protein [Streptomyces sp. CC208A]|uniref:DUF397 domain-containing protein n=1 Tax=Streptomyces sp. CC208A TaxID=3044573 RepID=UPI0024A9A133|nr:DUF397 domain-containing protein [Streptomyces sp. CC208A]
MAQHELSKATWIKSSYSGNDGGNCVEIAPGPTDRVPIRDSKAPEGPAVVFERTAWDTFVHSL